MSIDIPKPKRKSNKPPWRFYLADGSTSNFVLFDDGKPWAKHKYDALLISDSYLRLSSAHFDLSSVAPKISSCGEWLKFSECVNGHKEARRLIGSSFCRQRLCPMCNWRRSLLVAGQAHKVCHVAHDREKVDFLMLTVTVKNCDSSDFSDHVTLLTKSLSKLLNYSQVKKFVVGWFRGFETTISHMNGFHPHYHVLLAVKPSYFSKGYIPHSSQEKGRLGWVQLWQRALKVDYLPSVDIKSVKKSGKGVAGAAAEVAKYACKSSDIIDKEDWDYTDRNVLTLHYALRGRRSFAYGGILKSIHRELFKSDVESEDAELTDPLDGIERCTCPVCSSDLAERTFRWVGGKGAYISKGESS